MFRGARFFLSNFYPCVITYRGVEFPTAEHAYVAAKTGSLDCLQFERPGDAKKWGRLQPKVAEWNDATKLTCMLEICRAKFTQNPDLLAKLIATAPEPLVETNTWKDTFWGVCNGQGQNWLGRILTAIRDDAMRGEQNG